MTTLSTFFNFRLFRRFSRRLLASLALAVLSLSTAWAAPYFGEPIVRRQPDGTEVNLFLWGDEFSLVAETADGRTVVHDADGSWCYARRSDDGHSLVSSGLRVGAVDPVVAGVPVHVRIDPAIEHATILAKRTQAGIHPPGVGGSYYLRSGSPAGDTFQTKPAVRVTVGTYKGICILVDFSDDVATHSRGEIDNLMNLPGYNGSGNSGSVHDYYNAVSNGRLNYTNVLPDATMWSTGYYRAKNPRAYYDQETDTNAVGAQALIVEALTDLKAKGFDFSQLSHDSSGSIYALNVLYAGLRPDFWATGLWPHSYVLSASLGGNGFSVGNGLYLNHYQISDLPPVVPIGIICHENGHMLCDFPDLYSYDDIQATTVGFWCLMGSGAYGGPNHDSTHPTQICGYLRYKAGWTDAIELTEADRGSMKVADAATNDPYLLRRSSSEYFLIENRNRAGFDDYLPASGLAIYHVDERGDNASRYLSETGQWECALIQADGGNALATGEDHIGSGHDVFSSTSNPKFSYLGLPAPTWYSGQTAPLALKDISATGSTMSFTVDFAPGWVSTVDQNDNGSKHCGIGGGIGLIGMLLGLALHVFLRRHQRER